MHAVWSHLKGRIWFTTNNVQWDGQNHKPFLPSKKGDGWLASASKSKCLTSLKCCIYRLSIHRSTNVLVRGSTWLANTNNDRCNRSDDGQWITVVELLISVKKNLDKAKHIRPSSNRNSREPTSVGVIVRGDEINCRLVGCTANQTKIR